MSGSCRVGLLPRSCRVGPVECVLSRMLCSVLRVHMFDLYHLCLLSAVMFKEPRFYKAHTEYNPRFMSENVGMEDDELEFKAGDIIKVPYCWLLCSCVVNGRVSTLILISGNWNGRPGLVNRTATWSRRSGPRHLCRPGGGP